MWPPPSGQCHENANGRPAQPISSRTWAQVSAVFDVRVRLKLYFSYSGQPPVMHAAGVGELPQSVRPNRRLASSACCTFEAGRMKFIVIWPLAAQHHMLVSWPCSGTPSVRLAGGVQTEVDVDFGHGQAVSISAIGSTAKCES